MIKINGDVYHVKYFPDGTLNMTNSFIQYQDDCEDKVVIIWKYENIAEQIVLYNLVHFIKDKLGAPVELILPYIPNARMDRTKVHDTEVHTLKYFCKFINDLGFTRVYVTDPHSDVSATLLDRAIEWSIDHYIEDLVEDLNVDVLFFPDEGAFKRYSYLPTHTNGWVLYGHKERDWNTGKIVGYEIRNPNELPPPGNSVLIVDDICSYGGTFLHAAKALKEMGNPKIYLYVTHCENSVLKGELINSGLLEGIYTTDSIFTGEHPLIHVIKEV